MALTVGGCRADRDAAHGAPPRAADHDRPGSRLAGDQEIAGAQARARQLRAAQSEHAVGPLRGRAGRSQVGDVRRAPVAEAGCTKPIASTPMSWPTGRPDSATRRVRPPEPNARMRPLVSSAAIRSPAKRPNERGATAIPPSTFGPSRTMTRGRPRQSIAYNVVACPTTPATSRRDPNRPTPSNAMPEGNVPAGRSAKRLARPRPSTRTTPGVALGSRAKRSPRRNEQPARAERRSSASATYGSPAVAT